MAIHRQRPSVGLGDNTQGGAPNRSSWYGDAYQVPVGTGRNGVADEGSYFTGVNATLATAIAGHVAPALADNATTPTKALLHVFNAGERNITIDYLKLALEVVNASSTSTNFVVFLDNLGSTGRSSGGTAITPVSCRSDGPFSTSASVYFGAVVVASNSTVKKIAQWTVRPVIAVAEDQYHFRFGADPALPNTATHIGTAISNLLVQMPPAVVAPGGNFYFCESNPSGASTAATYEFEFGYFER